MKKLMLRLMATACAMLVLMSIPLNCMATSAAGAVTAPLGRSYSSAVNDQVLATLLSAFNLQFNTTQDMMAFVREMQDDSNEYYENEGADTLAGAFYRWMNGFSGQLEGMTEAELREFWTDDAQAVIHMSDELAKSFEAYVQSFVNRNAAADDSIILGEGSTIYCDNIADVNAILAADFYPYVVGTFSNKELYFKPFLYSSDSFGTRYGVSGFVNLSDTSSYCTSGSSSCMYISSGYDPSKQFLNNYRWYVDKLNGGLIIGFSYNGLSKGVIPLDGLTLKIPGRTLIYSGSVALPAPDSLVKFPSLPKEHADGSITYAPDLPLAPEDALVKNPPGVVDIPFDKVIDAVTGKDIVDTADSSNPDKPSEPDQPGEDVELPGSSELSLPRLISTKFPFCIPFDLYRMLSLLASEPKEPVFTLPIKIGNLVDEKIVLDFSKFSGLIEIMRWGEWVLFVGGLASVTRNYIKW